VVSLMLAAAGCVSTTDESVLPETADGADGEGGATSAEADADGGGQQSESAGGESAGGDSAGDEADSGTDQGVIEANPYCLARTGAVGDALADEAVTFLNDPAGLVVAGYDSPATVFDELVTLSTALVDLAPTDVADDAARRQAVAEAYVAALDEADGDVDALAALTIDADDLASLATLADHDEGLCQLRDYTTDEGWEATDAAVVPTELAAPFDFVTGFTEADSDLMAAAVEPDSPAAVYAAYRDASLEFLPDAAGSFRPVVDGDELLACNFGICARYSSFSLNDDGLVRSYAINALPLDRAVMEPIESPVTSADGSVTIDWVRGYVDTADQLQLVVQASSAEGDVDLDVLSTAYQGPGATSSLQTSVPSEFAATAAEPSRALLIFRSKARLPGTVTFTFDNGATVEIDVQSMAARP
jgi:hypothetical protein